jgi:hypothetical protein
MIIVNFSYLLIVIFKKDKMLKLLILIKLKEDKITIKILKDQCFLKIIITMINN